MLSTDWLSWTCAPPAAAVSVSLGGCFDSAHALLRPASNFLTTLRLRFTASHERRVSHPRPVCCCRTTPRIWRASSRTPTWTDSTGHRPWPRPGSERPRRPGTAPAARTPGPPTSAASAATPAPPLLRSRMKTCQTWDTLSFKKKKKMKKKNQCVLWWKLRLCPPACAPRCGLQDGEQRSLCVLSPEPELSLWRTELIITEITPCCCFCSSRCCWCCRCASGS